MKIKCKHCDHVFSWHGKFTAGDVVTVNDNKAFGLQSPNLIGHKVVLKDYISKSFYHLWTCHEVLGSKPENYRVDRKELVVSEYSL